MRDPRLSAYTYVTDILREGSESDFEELTTVVEGFPNGTDVGMNAESLPRAPSYAIERSRSKKPALQLEDDQALADLALTVSIPSRHHFIMWPGIITVLGGHAWSEAQWQRTRRMIGGQ
jgi:hypothetical protein